MTAACRTLAVPGPCGRLTRCKSRTRSWPPTDTIATDRRTCPVIEAADQLAALVAGGRAAFDGDWMRQRAAERILEIVGEAPNDQSTELMTAHTAVPCRHEYSMTHPRLTHHHSPLHA